MCKNNITKINKIRRKIYNIFQRKRLINRDFSLISSNCNGAVILHDLGLSFKSPFVNLWIKPNDFIKMQYEDGKKPFWYLTKDEFSEVVDSRP